MYDCYNNIIGYSNHDCPCLADGRPADYNNSLSGLYLDGLANISALLQGDCDKNVWTSLSDCYDRGIKRFFSESNALLGHSFALKREPLGNQIIGQIKAKNTYSSDKNYGVVRIACNPIRGGYFTLNSLGTLFQTTGATDIMLYDNVDGFLETFEVDTTANKHKVNAIAKQYPLHSKYVECLEYYLVFLFDSANMPKRNKVDCGCRTTLRFDYGKPYYGTGIRSAPWTEYVMVGSTEIDDLSELDDLPAVSTNLMIGIVLDLSFGCKVNEVVCKDGLDFVGNHLAMSIAHAILYAIGAEVGQEVLKNTDLVPQGMLDRDIWEENVEEWNTKYTEHINFLIPKINIQANDCFTCKDVLGLTRAGLFA